MSPARFVLLALSCANSPVHAGVLVTLVPDPAAPIYLPDMPVRVDVFAQLDADSPTSIRVRVAQFDLGNSDSVLNITPIGNHPLQETQPTPGPIPFWNFGGSTTCANDETTCGTNYYVDGSISTDQLLTITYTGLTSSGSMQIVLQQTTPTLLGSFDVTLPNIVGGYLLDVLNADATDSNDGGEIRFGFSLTEGATIWRARDGEITGGQYRFFVGVPEPATLALLLLGTACLTTKNTKGTKKEKFQNSRGQEFKGQDQAGSSVV